MSTRDSQGRYAAGTSMNEIIRGARDRSNPDVARKLFGRRFGDQPSAIATRWHELSEQYGEAIAAGDPERAAYVNHQLDQLVAESREGRGDE